MFAAQSSLRASPNRLFSPHLSCRYVDEHVMEPFMRTTDFLTHVLPWRPLQRLSKINFESYYLPASMSVDTMFCVACPRPNFYAYTAYTETPKPINPESRYATLTSKNLRCNPKPENRKP